MMKNLAGNGGLEGATPLPDPVPTDPLLSDREVAAALGCARSSVWRWASEGVVAKPLKIGGMSRWRKSDIESVIAKADEARASS